MTPDEPVNPLIALIRDAAARYGTNADTLVMSARNESNFNPNAQNPKSTAGGLFQFLDKTWKQFGSGSKFDPAASADAAARFQSANEKVLRGAGLPVTPGTLYLAHFAGADGAKNILSARPDQPVSTVMSKEALTANPFLKNMTIADLTAWADRKQGGSVPTTIPATALAGMRNQAPAASVASGGLPAAITAAMSPTAAPTDQSPTANAMKLVTAALQPQQQMQAPEPIPMPTPPGIARARALAQAIAEKMLQESTGQQGIA